jgi:hypothetical protein
VFAVISKLWFGGPVAARLESNLPFEAEAEAEAGKLGKVQELLRWRCTEMSPKLRGNPAFFFLSSGGGWGGSRPVGNRGELCWWLADRRADVEQGKRGERETA